MLKRMGSLVLIGMALVALSAPLATRAAPAAPAIFNVNTPADDIDDNVGNGTCHTDPSGPAAGLCSLRAAVQEANRTSNPGGATVVLPAGIYTLTIPATDGAGDYYGDLNLTTPGVSSQVISIVGAGAESTIIDANQLDRVFSIGTGRTASISGVTIRNGYSMRASAGPTGDSRHPEVLVTEGGGIYNGGSLILTSSWVYTNTAYLGAASAAAAAGT